MGVRGLTTFIASHSDSYLQPYELCDSYLVIDGNNIASQLYKWVSKSDSAFGGDYGEYYKVVYDFFKALKKCNIVPVVIFDGGYEKKKIRTVLERMKTKHFLLKNSFSSFSTTKFFPLFMKQTFWQVMEDMSITCMQCIFEADNKIAAVARQMNCPVLSYDSDFFIYDVLYIPFSTMQLNPVRVEDGDNCVKFYIPCSMYNVTNFLKDFEGLEKSLLPLIATLLGNDFIQSSIFNGFFNNHVILPKSKNMTFTERKIYGVLHWLKKETLDSATALILSHLKKKDASKIVTAINNTIKEYTTSLEVINVNDLIKFDKTDIACKKGADKVLKLPESLLNNFCQCKILPFVIDLITLNTYFMSLQIEDLRQPSAHVISFPIIKAIYKILTAHTNQCNELKLYVRTKSNVSNVVFTYDSFDCLLNIDLVNLTEATPDEKSNALFSALNMCNDDITVVEHFTGEWRIYVLALIYWMKASQVDVSPSHVHAMLLMIVANQIVHRKTGFHKSNTVLLKHKLSTVKTRQEKEKEVVANESEKSFSELLSSVSDVDCFTIADTFKPLRQTAEKAKGKVFSVATVHSFACFQSCLFHLIQLNALLNFPFANVKVHEFYSGTLLYNLLLECKKKRDIDAFVKQLLQCAPSIAKVYHFFVDVFRKYLPINRVIKEKTKKKRKQKKETSEFSDCNAENSEHSGNSDCYVDENNPYFVLQKT